MKVGFAMKTLMAGLIILAILAVGCTGPLDQETEGFPEASPTPTDSLSPTQETVQTAPVITTLRIWVPPEFDPNNNTPAGNLLRDRLEAYSNQRPDIQIETRVKASSGSGGLLDSLSSANSAAPSIIPDLILLPRSSLEIAALKGLLYPLDGFPGLLDDGDWFPFAQELGKIQNSIYGLPFAGDAMVSVYRPAVSGTPAENWSSALEAGQSIAFPAAEENAHFPLAQYLSTGAQVQDADGRPSLDNTPLINVLAFFQEAEAVGVMPSWLTQFTHDQQSWDSYADNRVDTTITWINRYLNALPGDSAAAPIITQDGTPYTLATGWVWGLSTPQTSRHAISVDLADFLTDSEFLSQWSEAAGYLPPRSSALEGWSNIALRNLVARISESAHLIPPNEIMAVVAPALNQATMEILRNQSTPSRAALAAIESLENP